jgi:hypothetical protein
MMMTSSPDALMASTLLSRSNNICFLGFGLAILFSFRWCHCCMYAVLPDTEVSTAASHTLYAVMTHTARLSVPMILTLDHLPIALSLSSTEVLPAQSRGCNRAGVAVVLPFGSLLTIFACPSKSKVAATFALAATATKLLWFFPLGLRSPFPRALPSPKSLLHLRWQPQQQICFGSSLWAFAHHFRVPFQVQSRCYIRAASCRGFSLWAFAHRLFSRALPSPKSLLLLRWRRQQSCRGSSFWVFAHHFRVPFQVQSRCYICAGSHCNKVAKVAATFALAATATKLPWFFPLGLRSPFSCALPSPKSSPRPAKGPVAASVLSAEAKSSPRPANCPVAASVPSAEAKSSPLSA